MNSFPYSKLALIYDRVMSHVNYPMWAAHISNLLKFSKINLNRVVDLSCGTGTHLQNMKVKKARLFGSDISLPMVKRAKENQDGKEILLFTQDARNLALKDKSVDAVIMLYDSINYMILEWEVQQVFNEIKRILNPNGLFIFDFVTQEGLRDCYEDYYESDSWDGLSYERHSWFSFKEKIQHNEFLFLYNGNSYKEVHQQKIRSIDEWEKAIKKSNMKLFDKFSNFSLLPASEKSERVHFVCQI